MVKNTLTRKGNIPAALGRVAAAADLAASRSVFADYQNRRAANTLRRQFNDLAIFADYLGAVGVDVEASELATRPAAWAGLTWGIVEGFISWQLGEGYAIGTVNVRLATVKVYARLAARAGAVDPTAWALIRTVTGFDQKEARRVDEKRPVVRVGRKKAAPVQLTQAQATQLKRQPDTPQGRRDALLMALLLDHGLRAGEVAGLQVSAFDLTEKVFKFYRQKVGKTQRHQLTKGSARAARRYFANDAPPVGPLLRKSLKSGELAAAGMSTQKLSARVRTLGEAAGIAGLSPHDCRHFWATQAARNGTQLDRLMDAGGWASPAMPMRYIQAAKIANAGVQLGD